MISIFTEDKKQPFLRLGGRLLLIILSNLGWTRACLLSVFQASSVTSPELVSLVSGCGHVVRYVVFVRLILGT